MSLEVAFLRDIVENPDDDAPRLAYADWLMEQDDEPRRARGEFVAVQCALARDEGRGPGLEMWKRRQRSLLRKHRKDWLGGLLYLGENWEFRRGFLDRLTWSPSLLTWGAVLDETRGLFRREPALRHLDLRVGEAPDLLLEILRMPELPRLITLKLRGGGLGATDAQHLADWPRLAEVRRLFLGNNPLGTHGLGRLLLSPHLQVVEALDLSFTWINGPALTTLATCEQLGRLAFLDLSGNPVTPQGLAELAGSARLACLRDLHLRDTNLTVDHVRALAGNLRSLDLSFNPLDNDAVAPLLDPSLFPALEEVRLVQCQNTWGMYDRFRARFRNGFAG